VTTENGCSGPRGRDRISRPQVPTLVIRKMNCINPNAAKIPALVELAMDWELLLQTRDSNASQCAATKSIGASSQRSILPPPSSIPDESQQASEHIDEMVASILEIASRNRAVKLYVE